VITEVLEDAPLDPRERNPKVPRAMSEVCLRALSKDPDRRQPSAEAFARELDAAIG